MNAPYAFSPASRPSPIRPRTSPTGALTGAEAESGTVEGYAVRTSPTAVLIFDTLGTERDCQARSNGEIAAAVTVKADGLLDGPPEILLVTVKSVRICKRPRDPRPLAHAE